MNAFEHGTIRFDEVEIDLDGRRLLVAGIEQPLEPKAFSVLALLAQHPGHAFTRDEILDAVWGHRHVTPGVLNRAITLARHALGESGDVNRYLHTLHGIGYRFDAIVHNGEARSAVVDATSNEPPRELPAQAIAEDTTPSNAIAPLAAPAPLPAVVIEPASAIAPEPSSSRQRVRPIRWLLVVLAATLLAATLVWLPRQPPPTTAATQPMLVVLPLHAIGSAQDEHILAEGLSEDLITDLSRVEGLRMISSTSAAFAQTGKFDLPQLADKLKVTHALEGSLRQSGDRLRIDLRLIEVPSGKMLWAQDYDRNLADVFAIQREVAQAVAGALELRLGLAAQSPAGDIDITLYRQYLESRSVLFKPEFTPGTPKQNAAREALRALIARAPAYARAHGLLARSLTIQVTPAFAPSTAQLDDAAQEAARALKLDTDNSDAHAVLAELACRRMDWDTCIAEYLRALALDPADVAMRGRYAFRLSGIGYLDAALREFDTAHRSDPLETTVAWQRARILDTLGRHDEAMIANESDIKQGVIQPQSAAYARWHNAVWRHDYAAAKEFALEMPESEGFRESYVMITQALQDATLWPQALKAIEASEQRTGRYNFARLLGPGYDAQAVFETFGTMLRDGFPSYFMLVWQPEYAALRRDPAFQNYIHNTHILDYWRAHGFPPQCHAEGNGAHCD